MKHYKESFDFNSLQMGRSIYFSKRIVNLPTAIDVVASLSITPDWKDFIQNLTMSDI